MRIRRGFSMVELMMVMVIISLLSAIAVPRLTQASANAQVSALASTMVNVSEAMQLYHAEHGRYPGYDPANGSPDGAWFHDQMLEYTDDGGRNNSGMSYPYIYGPYLRPPFPSNPFNGLNTVRVVMTKDIAVPLGSSGWIAVLSTGEFRLNSSAADLSGIGISDPDVRESMVGL